MDTKRIGDLTKERVTLMQKVKDRDDELKGKARFLEVCIACLFLYSRPLLTIFRMCKMK
jgi:hypothetical protein